MDLCIITSDGSATMKHPVHGEAYHSTSGARTEARDLYLVASGLSDILADSNASSETIGVLDVGLGLGYNALETIESWYAAYNPPNINLTSLEVDRDLIGQLLSGKAPWQVDWEASRKLMLTHVEVVSTNLWTAKFKHPSNGAKLAWSIHHFCLGTSDLPSSTVFDFVWFDPFSPKTSPELWTESIFGQIASVCAAGATLMTYSVARIVKKNLTAAGWKYTIIPTTTEKRDWLKAERPQ